MFASISQERQQFGRVMTEENWNVLEHKLIKMWEQDSRTLWMLRAIYFAVYTQLLAHNKKNIPAITHGERSVILHQRVRSLLLMKAGWSD